MNAPALPLWGALEAAARERTAGTPFTWTMGPALDPASGVPGAIRVTVADEVHTGTGRSHRAHTVSASTVVEPGTTPQHARVRVARLVDQVAAGLLHLEARR